MLIQRVNRNDSEKVFVNVLNVEGATITAGLPVAYATGNSMDGVSAVIANAAADFPAFIGIATNDIANNAYGLIQTSGWVSSILLSNVGSSITVNAGNPLVPAPVGFASAAPTYANSGFKYVIAATNVPAAISAASYVSGLIKMV